MTPLVREGVRCRRRGSERANTASRRIDTRMFVTSSVGAGD